MEHRIEYDDATESFVIATSGTATLAGFDAMRAELFAHSRFRPQPRVLIDHTGLDVSSFTAEEVRALATRALAPQYMGARIAVVSPSTHVFGTARQYEAHLEADGYYEFHVFRDQAAAFGWLTRPA